MSQPLLQIFFLRIRTEHLTCSGKIYYYHVISRLQTTILIAAQILKKLRLYSV